MTLDRADWGALIAARWFASARGTALAVGFPSYRPDLVRDMCHRLKARYCDFRQTRMSPLGWDAASLPLQSLDDTIEAEMACGADLVLQNAEALLSLALPDARRAWFRKALTTSWPRRLLLPVTLYAADLPPDREAQVVRLRPEELPEESLLDRLASFG